MAGHFRAGGRYLVQLDVDEYWSERIVLTPGIEAMQDTEAAVGSPDGGVYWENLADYAGMAHTGVRGVLQNDDTQDEP